MNTMQLGPETPGPDLKRLLMAVVASTLLFVVWQTFFLKPPAPQAAQEPALPAATEPRAPVAREPPESLRVEEAAADATPRRLPEARVDVRADVADNLPEDSDLTALQGGYRATVTNHGAQLAGFELTGYVDPYQKAAKGEEAPHIDLARGQHEQARLLALEARGGDVAVAPGDAYELVEEAEGRVVYSRLTAAGVRVTRGYDFDADRFGFTHKVTLKNESTASKEAALDLVLVGNERKGERDEGGLFTPSTDQLTAVCRAGDEDERWLSKDLEAKESLSGPVRFAGLDRHFFLAAVMPMEGTSTAGCRVQGWTRGQGEGIEQGLTLKVAQDAVTLQPGEEKTFTYRGYFGPKQLQALQQAGYSLDENIQFGWFGVLSRPMLWALVRLHDFFGNFGVAIILLTLLMKALTFPLTQKSYVSMQQMKTLAPELKKLQEKYGHDRATLGQKQMDLYKDKGINPMAGCFPVLVQMPVWFALYRTLWNSVELYQKPFYFGIVDLSQPDGLLLGLPLLPLLVGALMLVQTLMQPPPQDQPQMKYVMWGMPIMFTFFMLQMPSGLSIYMITNSLLTMAQQYYIKRKYA